MVARHCGSSRFISRRELDDRDVAVVGEQLGVDTRRAGELPTVTGAGFDVAHRDPLWDLGQRERVPGCDLGADADL